MNNYDQMRTALKEADALLRVADSVADDMAAILVGRLRKVSPYRLKMLKREIARFNAHTGLWEERR